MVARVGKLRARVVWRRGDC